MSGAPFLALLGRRVEATGSVLCVGLDPDPTELPVGFAGDVDGIASFARLVVETTAPLAAAFKANLAFFEAFGSPGLAALEGVRASIPSGIPFVADAKRGDIGPTAARQAAALIDVLAADAVTLNPYLGLDSVAPFIERGVFAYVLCRTSNPSAGELQDLVVAPDRERLHAHVATMVESWDAGRGALGLVVGATVPDELARVRRSAPHLPFLVPGVGAQGGSVEAALRHGPAAVGVAATFGGGGLLVNVSRGIARAALAPGGDPGTAIAEAAEGWRARLRVVHSGPESPEVMTPDVRPPTP